MFDQGNWFFKNDVFSIVKDTDTLKIALSVDGNSVSVDISLEDVNWFWTESDDHILEADGTPHHPDEWHWHSVTIYSDCNWYEFTDNCDREVTYYVDNE